MKAVLLAIVLVLLAGIGGNANAQITVPNDPCTGKPVDMDTVNLLTMNYGAGNLPECTPVPSLTSTEPHIRVNGAGVLGYGYCKIGPVWRLQYYAATWGFLTSTNIAGNLRAALAAPDPLTAFQQLTIANVTSKTSDPAIAAVWCPFVKEMIAGIPKPDPAAPLPPTYQVKANGATLTRPAVALVGGVKGTKELARAAVGQPCDTTRPTLASGADVWAEFGPANAPGVVALCSKKPS